MFSIKCLGPLVFGMKCLLLSATYQTSHYLKADYGLNPITSLEIFKFYLTQSGLLI